MTFAEYRAHARRSMTAPGFESNALVATYALGLCGTAQRFLLNFDIDECGALLLYCASLCEAVRVNDDTVEQISRDMETTHDEAIMHMHGMPVTMISQATGRLAAHVQLYVGQGAPLDQTFVVQQLTLIMFGLHTLTGSRAYSIGDAMENSVAALAKTFPAFGMTRAAALASN